MKYNFLCIAVGVLAFLCLDGIAQSNQKETLKVWGNCGMCEKKIEKAALQAGATKASWDAKSSLLDVTFTSSKTSLDEIQKAIAAVGYDTRDYTAPQEAYEALHGCCKYERKAATATCCAERHCGKTEAACREKKCCEGQSCCKM